MALAITPQDDFGALPNSGKASKRGSRPWLEPVLTATILLTARGGKYIYNSMEEILNGLECTK